MADDMKVSVDISADLSKLDSSLNVAEQKVAAAGRKMQSSLNPAIGIGNSMVISGPGAPSVPSAFHSNQVSFGGGLNVQRGANFGYGAPIGPNPMLNPTSPDSESKRFINAAAYTEMIGIGTSGSNGFGSLARSMTSRDPFLRSSFGAEADQAINDIPLVGGIAHSVLDVDRSMVRYGGRMLSRMGMTGLGQWVQERGTDPMAQNEALIQTETNKYRVDVARGMGGYKSQVAAMELRHKREMREVEKKRNRLDATEFRALQKTTEMAQFSERSNLEFERKWDLKNLDIAAGSETLRMFGSNFAADQMQIGAQFDKQIEMADRAKDSARSGKLQKLKEVSLMSSAIASMGIGQEMSGQGIALGGFHQGQVNMKDPYVIKALDRIANAVEDNAGGVPLAR